MGRVFDFFFWVASFFFFLLLFWSWKDPLGIDFCAFIELLCPVYLCGVIRCVEFGIASERHAVSMWGAESISDSKCQIVVPNSSAIDQL